MPGKARVAGTLRKSLPGLGFGSLLRGRGMPAAVFHVASNRNANSDR
jgi:hypothetical protein